MADVVALRRSDRPSPVTPADQPRLADQRSADQRGLARLRASGLVRPASAPADPTEIAHVLPVEPALARMLPWGGLRRGSTVAVAPGPFSGATSLLYALLADATAAGAWCAVVGRPDLGLAAAAEAGVDLSRLALVPAPGPDWVSVVAALLDGVDIVVAATSGPVSATTSGRLAARARQRGSVLVPFGQWAGVDLTLTVDGGRWHGLGAGRGRLRRCELRVAAVGRGGATRSRHATLRLGEPVEPVAITGTRLVPVPGVAAEPARLGLVYPTATDVPRLARVEAAS